MLGITLADLRFRSRQFAIAIVGAGLVFAMTLLLTGLANGFSVEIRTTVGDAHADAWVVAAGSSGPFSSVSAIPAGAVAAVTALPGVQRADPLAITSESATWGTHFERVMLIGFQPGGLGSPSVSSGRPARAAGEAVVDALAHRGIGSTLEVAGRSLRVVGILHGHTLLGGMPDVYTTIGDVRAMLFDGQPVATAIALRGRPTAPLPVGLKLLSNAAVRADTQKQMLSAVQSIGNTRVFMWFVAAVIVAALIYVSVLERVRDFAVFKAMGASSATIFGSVALQAIAVALLAAVLAAALSAFLKPVFTLPVAIPASAFLVLPISAFVIGIVASLVALRRAVSVDPALAFAGA